jgi:hypothetical protein
MKRPRKELIVCTLAAAFLVVTLRPSIGVEISVPAGQVPALIGTEHLIVVDSVLGTKGMPPPDGIPPSSDAASAQYIYQAKNNDLVQCSCVSKVIVCHRTVRSCGHRLLLPRPLHMQAPEPRRNRLLPLASERL